MIQNVYTYICIHDPYIYDSQHLIIGIHDTIDTEYLCPVSMIDNTYA